MKREDLYIQEALKYAQSDTLNAEALAFIAGMKMADTYPNWIKVADELPEEINGHTVSEFVLVSWSLLVIDVGEISGVSVAQYDYAKKEWLNRDGKKVVGVTHWMPIVLPKEK